MTRVPPLTLLRRFDTHRLVPSRHLATGDSVLVAIAEDDGHLRAIFELDLATNDRLAAEQQHFPGIGLEELVFGVPYAHVVNAAFCHPHPLGSRFGGPDRGAWYAGFELETSQAEVGFHKSVQLAEVGRFEDSVTYDDFLADFTATFHDLRKPRGFRACLDPTSYLSSQELAERLLAEDSLGVIYPSVRRAGGTCLACFRPALVANVRKGPTYRFTWDGTAEPVVTVELRRTPGPPAGYAPFSASRVVDGRGDRRIERRSSECHAGDRRQVLVAVRCMLIHIGGHVAHKYRFG